MVKIEQTRKAHLRKDGVAVIESTVREEVEPAVYKEMYNKKQHNIQKLEHTLKQAKSKRRQLKSELPDNIPEEVKVLSERLKLAQRLNEYESLAPKIKDMEVDKARMKKELRELSGVMNKIQQMEHQEERKELAKKRAEASSKR